MGNWNPKYFEKRKGSLEQSILDLWQEAALDPSRKRELKKSYQDKQGGREHGGLSGTAAQQQVHKDKRGLSHKRAGGVGDDGRTHTSKYKDNHRLNRQGPSSTKQAALKDKLKNLKKKRDDLAKEREKLAASFDAEILELDNLLESLINEHKGNKPHKHPHESLEDSPNPANSQHLCAKNVVHEEWGSGQCIPTMHAEPDEDGDISWYDVMFEHGVEKGVSINELKVTKSEMHIHASKKKVKKEALSAKQKKIDVDGDGEIEGSDLAALRAKKKKNEQKTARERWEEAYRLVQEKDTLGGDTTPDEDDGDDTPIKKKGKTATGKKPATIDMNPDIEEGMYGKKKKVNAMKMTY